MKTYKQALPLLFLIIATGIGYFGSRCGIYSQCALAPVFHQFTFTILEPLWIFCALITPVAVLVIFLSSKNFQSTIYWLVSFLLISILIILDTPTYINSMHSFYSPNRAQMAQFVGIAFTIISFVLIAWKSFSAPRNV